MSVKDSLLNPEASTSSSPFKGSSEQPLEDIERFNSDFTFNLVIVGARSVGKTALNTRIGKRIFSTIPPVATGPYFFEREVKCGVDTVNVKVWDIADLEIPNTSGFIERYLRAADAVLFVFDMNNLNTLNELKNWELLARKYCVEDTCFALVANKLDDEDRRQVFKKTTNRFAKRYNMQAFETSAMINEGVERMLSSLVNTLTAKARIGKEREERQASGKWGFTMAEVLRNLLCSRTPRCRAHRSTSHRASRPSASRQSASRPSASRPSASRPSAWGPSVSGPSTLGHSASGPSASDPSASRPSASRPSASRPSASRPSASRPSASRPSASGPSASRPSTSRPSASRPSASRPSASRPSASRPSASGPTASENVLLFVSRQSLQMR